MNRFKIISILLISISIALFSCKKQAPKDKEARSTIVDAAEINSKLKSGKPVAYQYVTIIGDIDFTLAEDISIEGPNVVRHTVESSIVFTDCTFKGKLIANKKKIKNWISAVSRTILRLSHVRFKIQF